MGIAKEEILSLSIEDRLQLLDVLWESITEAPDTLLLSDAHKQELDRRLDDLHADPASGRSWDSVRDALLKRR